MWFLTVQMAFATLCGLHVCSFVHSFVRSFIHSLVCSFIYSLNSSVLTAPLLVYSRILAQHVSSRHKLHDISTSAVKLLVPFVMHLLLTFSGDTAVTQWYSPFTVFLQVHTCRPPRGPRGLVPAPSTTQESHPNISHLAVPRDNPRGATIPGTEQAASCVHSTQVKLDLHTSLHVCMASPSPVRAVVDRCSAVSLHSIKLLTSTFSIVFVQSCIAIS